VVMDNCPQACSRMAGMAKGRREVLLSNVYSRRSVWREGDVNFRRKDVTKKAVRNSHSQWYDKW
jgi:hypothetical protein